MRLLDTDKAQAVLFFGADGISKELLYPELEALLEGFVPIDEWVDTTQRAVYVEFNHRFCPTAAVFFLMEFTSKGFVDAAWNLPLFDMARTAHKGPDLGAGPIHLACASHCPIAYFEKWMWDPDIEATSVQFAQIRAALQRNRLGVHFKSTGNKDGRGAVADGEGKSSLDLGAELRDQLTDLLKDQHLRIAAIASERETAVKEVRLEFTQKVELLQRQLRERDDGLNDALHRNEELKATIAGQLQKIDGLREYFEHKLQRYQTGEVDPGGILRSQFQAETDAKVAAAVKEMNDVLKIKEAELGYRQEHEEQLQRELSRLKQENQELLDNGGDHLLEKLSRKGVNFVTYQPGAGHITIPISAIAAFLESPSAFTAAYCGVSEKHYLAWLKHYHAPVCVAAVADDDICAADVARVIDPVKFVVGESDHCSEHSKNPHPVIEPNIP
jgi:hypothetical protein